MAGDSLERRIVHPFQRANSAVVRLVGTDLLTIRVELD